MEDFSDIKVCSRTLKRESQQLIELMSENGAVRAELVLQLKENAKASSADSMRRNSAHAIWLTIHR